MHRILLFDLDGTLIDTSEGIFSTANYTMNRLGYAPLSDHELRKFVGPPLAACFRVTCGLDESLIDQACSVYREEYNRSKAMLKAAVYEGIPDLLRTLKRLGCMLGVATLKLESLALEMLDHFDLLPLFTVVSGADHDGIYTKADIIVHALDALQHHQRSDVLLVGDTLHDLHGARESNVHFMGVNWGFGFTPNQCLETDDTVLGMISEPHALLDYL